MGEREQSITNIRQVILSGIEEILGEDNRREFDGNGLSVNFDFRCKTVVVERMVDGGEQVQGYSVSLQDLPDQDRFTKTFGLDSTNSGKDQFMGTVMILGDYRRLTDLISQLK